MEGNEIDKLDMVAYRRASDERKVSIEKKSHVFCFVFRSAQDPIFPEVDYWWGIPH